jgi:DEAD/DEAH box helicase domain-containing protein
MRVIVFDIETTNTFQEAKSSKAEDLTLAIVGTYDSHTGLYDSFLVDDLPRLWKLIESADALVGYNSDHFDIPLLNKYYPGDLTAIKSIDIIVTLQAALNRRIKLDSVASGTLGEKKSGDGLQSIRWWRQGKFDMVREYCLKDVEITKKIYDYALKNRALRFTELGKTKEVRLDLRSWEKKQSSSLTQTLGF